MAGTPFHLFCVDLQMPVKDGLQASNEIREYERESGLPRCRIVSFGALVRRLLNGSLTSCWLGRLLSPA